MASKFHISQWKTSQLLEKFFKLEEIEYYVNSRSYFQQWNLNWDTTFSNSSLDSKLGFLSVGLVLHFQAFPNSPRDWKFLNAALADFFLDEKLEFWSPLDFIFFQNVRILFQALYMYNREGTKWWLNCPFSRKKMYIFFA